mgnify:CR=1 FL=1
MGLTELFIIAVGLSMDAFAVSVCKGLSVQKMSLGHALICGVYFGGFQALMPAIGYLLGSQFEAMITQIDHWIAFVLLAVIGGNMIKESRECEAEKLDSSFAPAAMLPLAVATSIDALQVNTFWAVLFIGVVTFLLSAVGVRVGHVFGVKYKSKAELAGGLILILMGTKILLEHLGILA